MAMTQTDIAEALNLKIESGQMQPQQLLHWSSSQYRHCLSTAGQQPQCNKQTTTNNNNKNVTKCYT